MLVPLSSIPPGTIIYPEFDGKPMADNTRPWEWMVRITAGLMTLFRDRPNVFVAGDLIWYPVEGRPKVRTAPDALVVFGRPQGHRGSYIQFREENVPPQVVFDVLSPKNTKRKMARKRRFYSKYGVEEYYEYDPDHGRLRGWLRGPKGLTRIDNMDGWRSPRLGVRFSLEKNGDLRLEDRQGAPFLSHAELAEKTAEAIAAMERARRERRAEARLRRLAEQERQRAEAARDQALRRLAERDEAMAQLRERLRALGIDPETQP